MIGDPPRTLENKRYGEIGAGLGLGATQLSTSARPLSLIHIYSKQELVDKVEMVDL